MKILNSKGYLFLCLMGILNELDKGQSSICWQSFAISTLPDN